MVKCIRVPLSEGEPVRSQLRSEGRLDLNHSIVRDGDSLLIPIIGDAVDGHTVIDADLKAVPRREGDYRRLADVPEGLRDALPSSFDVIGDVAVLKLDDELMPFAENIAAALMEANQRLRSVALDKGVKGELRIRDLEVVKGDTDLTSFHTEFGVVMEVDPSLAYFNPRLSSERRRVADMVADGEVIADMFAGVGPFPLVICKHAHPSHVYAIDLNPDAVVLMRKNIERNRMAATITALEGDSRERMRELPPLDRVIMNLPQMADEFLFYALAPLKPGGTIHLYKVLEREGLPAFMEAVVGKAATSGRTVVVEAVHELKTYSPTMSVYCLDLRC